LKSIINNYTGKGGNEMENKVTKAIANYVVNTEYDDLSTEAIHATKRMILDTVGCAVGGFCADVSKILIEFKRELGGTPEATILVTGDRTSCTSAAYVNAMMSDAIDSEETLNNSSHPSACVVMPAFAIAEKLGASGKEMIEAVTLGYDVASRVGLSLTFAEVTPDGNSRWAKVTGMSWTTFGAAVAAGKLLHLNEDEMIRTIGLAGYSAPVPVASRWLYALKESPRPMTKHGFIGLMAESGVSAALLAQKGFQSDTGVLDGDRGFWTFMGSLSCNWDFILGNLGKQWYVNEAAYKPYPSCRYINGALDLFLKILREQSLTPGKIDEIRVKMAPMAVNCYLDLLLEPHNEIDVEFSIPYSLAIAAFNPDRPGPEWMRESNRRNPQIAELAKKVVVEIDDAAARVLKDQVLNEGRYRKSPCTVEVKTDAGKVYSAHADYAKGDPPSWDKEPPMSDDELKEKFRNYTSGFIKNSKIEKAIEAIYDIDKVDNAGDIMKYLC
jgi:2-methylcitrate dehydratase PrpD